MTLKRVSGKFSIGSMADFNRLTRRLPIRLAVTTEKHFREGFEKGGGQTDASKNGWESRKQKERGLRRGILIKSGTLRRDVKQRMATFSMTIIATSSITIKYADVHNSGLRSGRGKGFTMPKREFIGKSKELEKKHIDIINDELKTMLI